MRYTIGKLVESFLNALAVAMNVVAGMYQYDKGYIAVSLLSFTIAIALLIDILQEGK